MNTAVNLKTGADAAVVGRFNFHRLQVTFNFLEEVKRRQFTSEIESGLRRHLVETLGDFNSNKKISGLETVNSAGGVGWQRE